MKKKCRLIPRVGGGSSGRVIGVPEGVFKCRFVWQITSRLRYFLSTGFFLNLAEGKASVPAASQRGGE